jgi:hypothetical protein
VRSVVTILILLKAEHSLSLQGAIRAADLAGEKEKDPTLHKFKITAQLSENVNLAT